MGQKAAAAVRCEIVSQQPAVRQLQQPVKM